MNEENKVYDGEMVFDKDEYINTVYPQIKANARLSHQKIKESYNGSFAIDVDEWSEQLLNNEVPE